MTPAQFFRQYGIDELEITRDADIGRRAVTRVDVNFGDDPAEGAPGYRVDFKVLGPAEDAYRVARRIGPPPECTVEWTSDAKQLGEAERNAAVTGLLRAIEDRVAKVHKEQSILNIQPVGKTFLLMDRTRFDVLADDGEGQLKIRLYRPEGTTDAGLNANDLLDGLYSGLITRI